MRVDALIGHTGLVGKTLGRQHTFEAFFNTSNIDAIVGQQFETLVCAAAPGSMFVANREPERDRAQIETLIHRLERVSARRFVLISSIAVFADCAGTDDEGSLAFQTAIPYGRHRRELEAFCEAHFEQCLVVRLPALFGPGLKKNFIFDLLNPVPTSLTGATWNSLMEQLQPPMRDALFRIYGAGAHGVYTVDRHVLRGDSHRQQLEEVLHALSATATYFHHPDTTYQYYDLARLWSDIDVAATAALRRLHLATEPLRARDIYARVMRAEMPSTTAALHREDMHTRHASLWSRDSVYLEDSAAVLDGLEAFFLAQREQP